MTLGWVQELELLEGCPGLGGAVGQGCSVLLPDRCGEGPGVGIRCSSAGLESVWRK